MQDSFYYELYYIMFNTGLRAGEVGALMWEDVDFTNKCIHVSKSLMCQYEDGNKILRVTTPKTVNSFRTIPFLGKVEEAFITQKKKQDELKRDLGGRWRSAEFGNLVFTSTMGSPIIRHLLEKDINKVVKTINSIRLMEATRTGSEYEEFERVHPHAIRHTFCSRCFECNMSPKVVQTIMGHAFYSTTMDIYTHVSQNKLESDISLYNKLYETSKELYENQFDDNSVKEIINYE